MKVSYQLGLLFVALGAMTLVAQPPSGRGGPGGGAGGPGGMRPPLIQALDLDQDGEISAEELKKAPESLLTLDKNKDGKLTEDEYRPQMGRTGGGPPGAGREGAGPPRAEGGRPGAGPGRGAGEPGARPEPPPAPNPERMVEHAFEFDADKDGKLSKEEMQKFAEDFAKHHPGPGGPRGENNDREGTRTERPKRPE